VPYELNTLSFESGNHLGGYSSHILGRRLLTFDDLVDASDEIRPSRRGGGGHGALALLRLERTTHILETSEEVLTTISTSNRSACA
jgi:hypothetical protein